MLKGERRKQINKIILIFFVPLLVIAIGFLIVSLLPTDKSEDLQARNGLTLEERSGYYVVTGIEIFNENVIIPESYNGKDVKEISSNAFENSKIKSITIPSSITYIGSKAFNNCSNLASIKIPSSVTSIGNSAFCGCSSLTSIAIPSSVTSIGEYAFSNCTNLERVAFGDNSQLISIDAYAFESCTRLTSIAIPSSVTSIGFGAFHNCTSLESIVLPFVGTAVRETKNSHFGYVFGSLLYEKNEDYVPTSLKSVVITGGANVGYKAFYNCTSLTSITISSSVTSFGDNAFEYCTYLESVTFGDSSQLTSIGKYTFYYCTNLKSLTIPSSVTSIGSYAFYNCTNLKSVTFIKPDGWWYSSSPTATSGTAITGLSYTSTGATYLKSTYNNYYWKRS